MAASRVADFSADARLAALAREAGPSSTSAQSAANNRNGSNGSNNTTKGAVHVKQEVKAEGEANESNEIGSDLDDSDDDDIGASRGADDAVDGGDFMIALYEKVSCFSHWMVQKVHPNFFKVTRVKNKWKVQLKDGIISVNGKDYLFSKCQG